jgi:Protein of unknown function (DUF1800)
VGTLRGLGLTTAAFSSGTLSWMLGNIGQVPFTPPSVGGWGSNDYWQSTGAAAGYIRLASALAGVADLTALENSNGHPVEQVNAALALIGRPEVSNRTRSALISLGEFVRTADRGQPSKSSPLHCWRPDTP